MGSRRLQGSRSVPTAIGVGSGDAVRSSRGLDLAIPGLRPAPSSAPPHPPGAEPRAGRAGHGAERPGPGAAATTGRR